MGYLVYVGNREKRAFMYQLCLKSRFKGDRFFNYTAEALEERLYEAKGIILVGYQSEVFSKDKNRYKNLIEIINRRSIPLAAVLNLEQKLPYENEGVEYITRQNEKQAELIAKKLDDFFAKYITDYFGEEKGQ